MYVQSDGSWCLSWCDGGTRDAVADQPAAREGRRDERGLDAKFNSAAGKRTRRGAAGCRSDR